MRRSLTRLRYPGNSTKSQRFHDSSFDSPLCAEKDGHLMEFLSDPLKVVIVHKVSEPKNVSRFQVVEFTRYAHRSNPLGELSKVSSDHTSISSKLGKWCMEVSEISIF